MLAAALLLWMSLTAHPSSILKLKRLKLQPHLAALCLYLPLTTVIMLCV